MAPPKKRPSQRKRPQQARGSARSRSSTQSRGGTQGRSSPQAQKLADGNGSVQGEGSSEGTGPAPGKSTQETDAAAQPRTTGQRKGAAQAKRSSSAAAQGGSRGTESQDGAQASKVLDERKAKREAARLERIEAARRKEREKRRKRILIALAILVAVAVLVIVVVQRNSDRAADARRAAQAAGCGPVQEFANQGRGHLGTGELANSGQNYDKYNSNPPTSGPHRPQPALWGSYKEPVDKETLVHNLEHGGIVINYKDLPPGEVDELETLADSYRDGVISNPNDTIDKPIVMTSWTRMQKCDRFSTKAIEGYIDQWCGKGPEKLSSCRK